MSAALEEKLLTGSRPIKVVEIFKRGLGTELSPTTVLAGMPVVNSPPPTDPSDLAVKAFPSTNLSSLLIFESRAKSRSRHKKTRVSAGLIFLSEAHFRRNFHQNASDELCIVRKDKIGSERRT